MKFTQYLTENRSTAISETEFDKYVTDNCSDIVKLYKKHTARIYRGVSAATAQYLHVNPSLFTRTSLQKTDLTSGTKFNYYTLLLDNLPAWRKFPKRSKSLICTTSSKEAQNYGQVYVVYPKNGSTIVVCPSDDLWHSFNYELEDFNVSLHHIFITCFGDGVFDQSYTTLLSAIQKTEQHLRHAYGASDFDAFKHAGRHLSRNTFVDEYWIDNIVEPFINRNVPILDSLAELLAPQGFNKYTTKNLKLPVNYREIYTNGDAVLMKHTEIKQVPFKHV